ncbi:MAG: plasmid replication/partition related protein [Rhizobacter sp.]|nr:plasmid replication/partition related protein [Rhizobacter sp.]
MRNGRTTAKEGRPARIAPPRFRHSPPATVNIVVNEDLKTYIDPLTPEEHDALERSLLAEGCRDALVLWGDMLVDGHNRFGICNQHGLPFQTLQNASFRTIEDVHLWMIDQHLGRRSVSDFQRGVLALRKKEIIAGREGSAGRSPDVALSDPMGGDVAPDAPSRPAPEPLKTREAVAKAARLSSSQVVMIEKIQRQAAPELVAAVRSGTLSINAAAAVCSLPREEQVAAVAAGKEELRQAARRAREAHRKPRAESETSQAIAEPDVRALQQRIDELTAENESLRRRVAELQAG